MVSVEEIGRREMKKEKKKRDRSRERERERGKIERRYHSITYHFQIIHNSLLAQLKTNLFIG